MAKLKDSRTVRKTILLLIGTTAGWHGAVEAAGFQLYEFSARGLGSRNAGASAAAQSAETVFFNPAGLAKLKQREVEATAHLIIPSFDFKDTNSSNAIGGPAEGDPTNDGGGPVTIPTAFMAMPINDKMTFGFGVSTPYGLITDYDKDWIGRYNAIHSEVKTIDLNPAIGFRVSDRLSLGVGVSAQYMSAELTNAMDFGTVGFLSGIPNITPSTLAYDGFARVEGDSWGWGFNLGALFEISDKTRVGVGYRSEVDQSLEGTGKVGIPSIITQYTGLSSFTRNASVDVTLPATIYLDFHHQVDDKFTLMGGLTWTGWSAFDELRIKFDSGSDSVQPENWNDVWRYTLGLEYKASPVLTLRTGVQYDESPVPDHYRTPRVPGTDMWSVALGATWKPAPKSNFTLDFAYNYVWADSYRINDTEVITGDLTGLSVGNTLAGTYEADAHIVSVQAQWNF